MNGYLLDTNCVSEMVRPEPNPGVISWLAEVDEGILYLSVLTLGEVRKGLASQPPGKRRIRLEAWLDLELAARFAGRILSIDAAVANRWGLLAAAAKREGKSLPVVDGLLAATALHHSLTIVSRNAGDFTNVRVEVLNPWQTYPFSRMCSAVPASRPSSTPSPDR